MTRVNWLMEYLMNMLMRNHTTGRVGSSCCEWASEGEGRAEQAADMHALQDLQDVPGHLIAEVSGSGSFKKAELNLGFDALRMWAGNAMQEERGDHASQRRCTMQRDQNVL